MSAVPYIALALLMGSSSSLPLVAVVSSRVDCVSRCHWNDRCSSLFYDSSTKMCYMEDTVYVAAELQYSSMSMQRLEWNTGRCNSGEIWYRALNMCVKMYTNPGTWQDAENTCIQGGGHLMKIDSAEIMGLMGRFSKVQGYLRVWSGGNDMAEEGTWVWADNSTVQTDFWSPGYPETPSKEEEDCMFVISNGTVNQWQADPCRNNYYFICQLPARQSVFACEN